MRDFRDQRWLNADRLGGGAAAALTCGLIGYALVLGLHVSFTPIVTRAIATFAFAPPAPPPPKPVAPHPVKSKKAEGAASPANLRAKPTEIVAPKPPVPVPPRPPAAPKAGPGAAASAGAAPVPGPGTGAGGEGNGTGSGAAGDGEGEGGTDLQWIKGSIRDSDYPKAALIAGASGTVGLRFIVGVNGRVTSCTVTRSSGNADLDSTTCRLIMERFRYEPTRNARGVPIPDEVIGEHVWELRHHREEPNREQ